MRDTGSYVPLWVGLSTKWLEEKCGTERERLGRVVPNFRIRGQRSERRICVQRPVLDRKTLQEHNQNFQAWGNIQWLSPKRTGGQQASSSTCI